jgi:hypothetical protein
MWDVAISPRTDMQAPIFVRPAIPSSRVTIHQKAGVGAITTKFLLTCPIGQLLRMVRSPAIIEDCLLGSRA